MRKKFQRGTTAVEMAIVFLPLMLTILSTLELGRAAWTYHMLHSALKSGLRYAVVHGEDCIQVAASCQASISNLATIIRRSSVGLDGDRLQLTFTAGGNSTTCSSLPLCMANGDQWPPAAANTPGQMVSITGVYQFRSVLSGFWPGQNNGNITYVGKAAESILF